MRFLPGTSRKGYTELVISSLPWFIVSLAIFLALTRVLNYQDLVLFDEAGYLTSGEQIAAAQAFPPLSWGPGYASLYSVFFTVGANAVEAFYLVRLVSSGLLLFAVWLGAFILSGRIGGALALLVATLLPTTYMMPGVSVVAASIAILASCIPLSNKVPIQLAIAVSVLLLTLGGFFRPEYFVASIAVGMAGLVYSLVSAGKTADSPPRFRYLLRAGWLVGISVPFALILTALRGPDNRSWVAFAQHFSIRHTQPNEVPWSHYPTIAARTFGNAQSYIEATLSNPVAVSVHSLRNIGDLPGASLAAMKLNNKGPAWFHGEELFLVLLLALTVGSLFFWVIGTAKSSELSLGYGFDSRERIRFLPIVCVTLFSFVPIVVIYPRPYYLVPLFSLSAIVFASSVSQVITRGGITARRVLSVLVAAMLLVLAVSARDFARVSLGLRDSVHELRATDSTLRLLGPDRNLAAFLSGKLIEVDEAVALPGERTIHMLDRLDIDLLYKEDAHAGRPWTQTTDFKIFMENPEDFGFETLVPDSPLLIRR